VSEHDCGRLIGVTGDYCLHQLLMFDALWLAGGVAAVDL
jgi:hypothetical protein